jgi:hypothetical protein
MTTLHIGSFGALSDEERNLLHELAGDIPIETFDEDAAHLPRYYYAGGPWPPEAWVPLSWLVITFLGAGTAITIKSFLKELGKEAGKRLIDRLLSKRNAKDDKTREPVFAPLVLVYEARPGVIVVIHSLDETARSQVGELFNAVEDVVRLIPHDKGAMLDVAYFNGCWVAHHYLTSDPLPVVWDPKQGVFELSK